MVKKFLRRSWDRYSKLGKGRKKKQKWKKPTGRDNKMREKRKGYPAVVSTGYKTDKKDKGKLEGMIPVLVKNISDLEKIKANQIAIIGSVGQKKKVEIVKKAKEKKIKIHNINPKTFLKKIEKSEKPKDSIKEVKGSKKSEVKDEPQK